MGILSLSDLAYRWFSAALPVANGGDGPGLVVSTPQQVNGWTSKVAAPDTKVAPVQFTVMANIAVTDGAGIYKIQVIYGYGSTAEATTADNFQLVRGVASTSIALLPSTVGGANTLFPKLEFTSNVAAGEVIKVITNNAASAGSVYRTYLIVERIA